MTNIIVGSDELEYGMMVLFPNPGHEHKIEAFTKRPGEIAFEWVSPNSYWARIENIRRNGSEISFRTWDHNGVLTTRSVPHDSWWIIKKEADMSENTQPKVDIAFYEQAMEDALLKSFQDRDFDAFEKAIDRFATYALENSEYRGGDMPDTLDGLKAYLLLRVVQGFFEGVKNFKPFKK